jgi:hypothetical protein
VRPSQWHGRADLGRAGGAVRPSQWHGRTDWTGNRRRPSLHAIAGRPAARPSRGQRAGTAKRPASSPIGRPIAAPDDLAPPRSHD